MDSAFAECFGLDIHEGDSEGCGLLREPGLLYLITTPADSLLQQVLLSSLVQVPLPGVVPDVPAQLAPADVEEIFERHVPHLHTLCYRGNPNAKVIRFLKSCYVDGLSAFQVTHLNDHLLRLFRAAVHHGADDGHGAARLLTDLAEAFTDCQAVQARAIERVGLEIRGLARDFPGRLQQLLGDCKAMAVKMLAVERVQQYQLREDQIPTHYENRLTADLGELLGLNEADIRRAKLDGHAASRFEPLSPEQRVEAAARARELFDLDAFFQGLAAELCSFGPDSAEDSLAATFMTWAADQLAQPHLVLDQDACTRVVVDKVFARAVVERIYLGGVLSTGCYRDCPVQELFKRGDAIVV